ncbi:MAG: hypothetical protein ABIQ09_09285 [Jatrophihabitantaceae bacterium]
MLSGGREDAFSDDIDWLDVGSGAPGGDTPPRRPWPRWFTAVVVLAAVALVLTVLNRERGAQSSARLSAAPTTSAPTPTPKPTPTRTASETFTSPTPTTVTILPTASVTRLGRPLLGVTAGWELIGYSNDVLVRIELAAGRITRTPIPSLPDGGPVSLLVGANRVRIQPFGNVPGYLVPDGKAFRELPLLEQDGLVLPGPAADQMWLGSGDGSHPVMTLATLDGGKLAGSIPMPPELSTYDATADGAGGLLFSSVGGVYAAGPDGLRRISTGALAAVGPTGWLVTECDDRYRCQTVLIGRADGSRRIINSAISIRGPRGVISPDGATAAVMNIDSNGATVLQLLDLASGSRRVLKVSPEQGYYDVSVVFSPDSRWVFTVAAGGSLAVINRQTGAVGSLGVDLPAFSQIALRPAR